MIIQLNSSLCFIYEAKCDISLKLLNIWQSVLRIANKDLKIVLGKLQLTSS